MHGYDTPAPTNEQRRLVRIFRLPMFLGWALVMIALLGGDGLLPLLIPAGVIWFAGGAAFQTDSRGLREATLRVDAQTHTARRFGARTVTPLWGILAMTIGAGLVAGGIAAAV